MPASTTTMRRSEFLMRALLLLCLGLDLASAHRFTWTPKKYNSRLSVGELSTGDLERLPRTSADQYKDPATSPILANDGPSQPRLVEKIITLTTHVVKPRQQKLLDSATACQTSTAYASQVTCRPFRFNEVVYECVTSTATTIGCGVLNTATTTTLAVSTIQGRCAQTGCPACVGIDGIDNVASSVPPSCSDCTTSNGTVYASQATAFRSGTPQSKRHVDALHETVSGRLIRRTLKTAQDYPTYNSFMIGEVSVAAHGHNLVLHRPRGSGRSSARVVAFQDQPLNLAVQNLNGCTSVVVISRKGAWMSHFWEAPSFTSEDLFNEDILYGMFQGDESGWFPGLNQYSAGGLFSLFNTHTFGDTTNKVKVIIVTPSMTTTVQNPVLEDLRYPAKVFHIRSALQRAYNIEPEIVSYLPLASDPVELNSELSYSASGKVVLQYDPKQYSLPQDILDESGQIRGTCHEQWPMVRVYVGKTENPAYEDVWRAIPEQVAMPDENYQQVFARGIHGNTTSYACMEDTVAEQCNLTTLPPSIGSSTTAPGHVSCACNGSLATPVTQTGKNGSVTLGCVLGNKTIPVLTTTAAASLGDCSLTTDVAMITAGGYTSPLTHPPACACPSGISARLTTTYGTDYKGTILCRDSTASIVVGTATTSAMPTITSCSLESTAIPLEGYTQDKGQVWKQSTSCVCNGNVNATMSSSEGSDHSLAYYCSLQSHTGSALAVSTGPPRPVTPSCVKITRLATTRSGTTDATITQAARTERALTQCSCEGQGFHTIATRTSDAGTVYEDCMVGETHVPVATSTPTVKKPKLSRCTMAVDQFAYEASNDPRVKIFATISSQDFADVNNPSLGLWGIQRFVGNASFPDGNWHENFSISAEHTKLVRDVDIWVDVTDKEDDSRACGIGANCHLRREVEARGFGMPPGKLDMRLRWLVRFQNGDLKWYSDNKCRDNDYEQACCVGGAQGWHDAILDEPLLVGLENAFGSVPPLSHTLTCSWTCEIDP